MIEFYKNNGYVIIPGSEFLSDEEHKSLLKVSEELTNNTTKDSRWQFNSNGTINKLQGAVTFEPQFLKLSKNKRFLMLELKPIFAKNNLKILINEVNKIKNYSLTSFKEENIITVNEPKTDIRDNYLNYIGAIVPVEKKIIS